MSLEGFIANRRECVTVDLIRFTTVKQPDTGFESADWFVIREGTPVFLWEMNDEDVLREYGPEAEGRHAILIPTDVTDAIGFGRDDGIEVRAGQVQYAGRVFKIVSELRVLGYYFRGLLREMPREDPSVVPPTAESAFDDGFDSSFGV